MIWNVYSENSGKIESYNIFDNFNFLKDLKNMFEDISKEASRYRDEYKFDSEAKSILDMDAYQQHMLNFEDESLHKICRYHFWAKCEHEITLTSWPPHITRENLIKLIVEDAEYQEKYKHAAFSYSLELDVAKKVDIYAQLQLNWDIFKEYIFTNVTKIIKLYKMRKKDLKELGVTI